MNDGLGDLLLLPSRGQSLIQASLGHRWSYQRDTIPFCIIKTQVVMETTIMHQRMAYKVDVKERNSFKRI